MTFGLGMVVPDLLDYVPGYVMATFIWNENRAPIPTTVTAVVVLVLVIFLPGRIRRRWRQLPKERREGRRVLLVFAAGAGLVLGAADAELVVALAGAGEVIRVVPLWCSSTAGRSLSGESRPGCAAGSRPGGGPRPTSPSRHRAVLRS